MKSLILLATAAALVSATTAEAKRGFRIGGPRAYTSSPTSVPTPTLAPKPLSQPGPRRAAGTSGGVFFIPGVGPSRASAAPLDPRRGVSSSDQATPDWFRAAGAEAERSASAHEQSAAAPRPQKAAFQCPPGRLVGGFCVLN